MTQNSSLMHHVVNAGFPADTAMVHLFIGGSQLHGAKVSGYDDLDIYGAFVEPPQRILGLQALPHFVWSSGSARALNTADDVDVTCYSLHRWGELMMKGNPAVLHFLYAENVLGHTVWETHVRPHREGLLSQNSARQYLGFAEAQRMRLTGERGMGRHGQRIDLIEKYGYDTKFAMHYIRLLFECRELLRDRYLTLPRPERAQLIEIRTGDFTQDEVFELGRELRAECDSLLAVSTLPEAPDKALLSRVLADAYLAQWQQMGLCRPVSRD
jgi:predicted nucleotidyltransferase